MNEIFWYYIASLVFVAAMTSIFVLYRYLIADKYVKAEAKLRLKLNEATAYFKGDSEKVPNFLQKSIGSIGIDGIMDELGIDPKLLNNPLVKGLIDKYAPKLIEQLNKGGKLGEKSESEEINLL
jgi:hypothetical protein